MNYSLIILLAVALTACGGMPSGFKGGVEPFQEGPRMPSAPFVQVLPGEVDLDGTLGRQPPVAGPHRAPAASVPRVATRPVSGKGNGPTVFVVGVDDLPRREGLQLKIAGLPSRGQADPVDLLTGMTPAAPAEKGFNIFSPEMKGLIEEYKWAAMLTLVCLLFASFLYWKLRNYRMVWQPKQQP